MTKKVLAHGLVAMVTAIISVIFTVVIFTSIAEIPKTVNETSVENAVFVEPETTVIGYDTITVHVTHNGKELLCEKVSTKNKREQLGFYMENEEVFKEIGVDLEHYCESLDEAISNHIDSYGWIVED